MENLWRKEGNQLGSMYVDLFSSVPKNRYQTVFDHIIKSCKLPEFLKNNQRSSSLRADGTEKFKRECWSEAMNLYTRSLCFAEVGTENEALAFANRSACFFYMKRYTEALVDIELALKSNLPDCVVPKLERRKKRSQELQNELKSSTKYELKLSYTPNDHFPCMAKVIEIQCNKEFGRHLVAKSDIPVGKIVLMEDPFMALSFCDPNSPVSCDQNNPVCYTCYKEQANFIACANCYSAVFCSAKCLNQNLTHKLECGVFIETLEQVAYSEFFKSSTVRMTEIILTIIAAFPNIQDLFDFVTNVLREDPNELPTSANHLTSKYHFFFKLKSRRMTDEELIMLYDMQQVMLKVPKIFAYFNTTKKIRFLIHLNVHHFMICKTNQFDVGVYNVISMANHSCAPNLFNHHYQKKMCFETIRPVKKGDQLFICYFGSVCTPKEEQKRRLKTHDIICKCERCIPIGEPIDRSVLALDEHFSFIHDNRADRNRFLLDKCIKFLNKYGHYLWSDEIMFVITTYILTVENLKKRMN